MPTTSSAQVIFRLRFAKNRLGSRTSSHVILKQAPSAVSLSRLQVVPNLRGLHQPAIVQALDQMSVLNPSSWPASGSDDVATRVDSL